MPVPIRKIIHVDMDAFFASVEQRDFPEYRGKPLIVGGSPNGRGVVAAASYEVRKFGVHSAIPSSQAVRLCPHAIFVKPRFDVYRKVSQQIRDIFAEFTDLVEPLSLDEAYLDVTQNYLQSPSATLVARKIKKRIKEDTQITASAGVANNKFLAKIASDLDKPDGLAVIAPQKAEAFIEKLEVRAFPGIGKATEIKMNALGIATGNDLKKWSKADLISKFGKSGGRFYQIARGIDNRPVRPSRIRKSIGMEHTFNEDIDNVQYIYRFLDRLAEKVSMRLQEKSAAGKTVTLKIRYDDFETITRSSSFNHYINDVKNIAAAAKMLLQQTDAGTRKVRLLGITLSNLNLQKNGYLTQMELPFAESASKPPDSSIDSQIPDKKFPN